MSVLDQIKVGDKYGHWVVLENRKGRHFLCQCDCKNKTARMVSGYQLLKGESTSCGCAKQKYKTCVGAKFGHWTVLEILNEGGKCICQCDCKNKTIRTLNTNSLFSGVTKSCGCVNKKYEIHVGDKFGHLTVLELNAKRSSQGGWLHKCICDCKNKTICYESSSVLVKGMVRTCGCSIKSYLDTKTRFHRIWSGINTRCNNSKDKGYKDYGGRGIKICKRWRKFENFYEDMYESYQEHVKEYGENQTTIDRIDVNGDYCKENCRWATYKEQANNTRRTTYLTDADGTRHSIMEWERIKGINRSTLRNRVFRLGWSDVDAINKPARKINYKLSIKKE